jgi:hypothetical protein
VVRADAGAGPRCGRRRGPYCYSALTFAVIHRDSLYKKEWGEVA